MIILLVFILILCFFNSVSMFIMASVLMRNSRTLDNFSSIVTSVPPVRKRRDPRTGAVEPEALLDVQNSEYHFES